MAALTVFGAVKPDVGPPVTLSVFNTDVERRGLTIHALGAVPRTSITFGSLPGTPGAASFVAGDASMRRVPGPLPADLVAAGRSVADIDFSSTFGLWPSTTRWQPGAVRVDCAPAGCRAALSTAVALNPDRVIWVEGDLTLETAGDIGSLPNPADTSVAGPAVIIATGSLVVPVGGVRIFGLVYTRGGAWTGGGAIQGAAIAEVDLEPTAAQTVVFNAGVLDALRLRAGSFVRVPGGWRDFP